MREASAQDLIYEKISKNPKYHELVRRRQSLGWSLSAIMLVIYFGFILLVAFAPKLLGTPVASGVTTADRIKAAMIACFRYFASVAPVTTPSRARMVSTSGNSNAQPKINRNFTLKSM